MPLDGLTVFDFGPAQYHESAIVRSWVGWSCAVEAERLGGGRLGWLLAVGAVAAADAELGGVRTARNWTTVTKLVEPCEGP